MSAATLLVALVAGAGALAFWLDVRFPRLAPRELRSRLTAAVIAIVLVSAVPVSTEGGAATMASLLGFFLPTLCFALLTTLWLLRALATARG